MANVWRLDSFGDTRFNAAPLVVTGSSIIINGWYGQWLGGLMYVVKLGYLNISAACQKTMQTPLNVSANDKILLLLHHNLVHKPQPSPSPTIGFPCVITLLLLQQRWACKYLFSRTHHRPRLVPDTTKGHVFAIDYRLLDASRKQWLGPGQLIQMRQECAVMEFHGI